MPLDAPAAEAQVAFAADIAADALVRALQVVHPRPIRKANLAVIPILGDVLLECGTDGLRLTTTNMDSETVITVPGVTGTGAISVPAERLKRLLRHLQGGVALRCADGKDLRIEGTLEDGPVRTTFGSHHPDEYPRMRFDAGPQVRMDPRDLLTLLRDTAHAMGNSESRFYLNGAFLHVRMVAPECPMLCATATDGHRMAVRRLPVETSAYTTWLAALGEGIIVPRDVVQRLVGLLSRLDAEVSLLLSVTADRSKMRVVAQGPDGAAAWAMTFKTIDASYPDYVRVIPQPRHGAVLQFDRKAMLRTLRLVKSVLEGDDGKVRLRISAEGASLDIRADDLDNSVLLRRPCLLRGVPVVEFGIAAQEFGDLLQHVDDDLVALQVLDAATPIVYRPEPDSPCTLVVMPSRI